MFVPHVLKCYSRFAEARPRTAALVTGGILTGAGDCLAQYMEWRSRASKEPTKPFTLDTKRTLANGSFSAAYASCVYLPFFAFLGRRLGEVGAVAVASKVASDVFVLCPFVGLPSYFVWTGCIQGHSPHEVVDTMCREYASCYAGSLCIWPAVQTLNFALVPPHLRVSFVYVGQVSWAAMMSLFSNRKRERDTSLVPRSLTRGELTESLERAMPAGLLST
eukprot:TRINITY_DN50564_c0_g1_i1.p1 TRINITY_DN50564_c0_g1~~TRINITY_DN50564_c0_g1_i1.p1  ORF type:complete len:220 (-),score=11.99 TRINITY_DN50564_c0_g1_i1:162-821(-)